MTASINDRPKSRAILLLAGGVLTITGLAQEIVTATAGTEVTIRGSMVCNGACIPDPKADDHVKVVYAIDGTADIKAAVDNIMAEFYPDSGLDGDAAEKLLNQFTARLKYHISPDSPALQDAKTRENHYCMPAVPRAMTGIVSEEDGKKWITAVKITPTKLKYPDNMLAPDKPFAMPDKEPLLLKINDQITLKCISIPPGRFLMGTPFYMWPYFMEEYPHMVTLTKPQVQTAKCLEFVRHGQLLVGGFR